MQIKGVVLREMKLLGAARTEIVDFFLQLLKKQKRRQRIPVPIRDKSPQPFL